MSKAVLVLDEMPSSCGMCKLEKNNRCCITGKGINTVVRPVDKCPLCHVPKRYNKQDSIPDYCRGWNDAIDEIGG
ncbi:MAG: hypothetical protein LUE87_06425 [Lachnospiraceae bacterium]|nr:hypothetical protein [Lachnospiraceae bacterium]